MPFVASGKSEVNYVTKNISYHMIMKCGSDEPLSIRKPIGHVTVFLPGQVWSKAYQADHEA
ncbi:MAG TPA: hypothetical protein VH593_29325 [Ktedonobacteraceae bacterium]|jgi:hypothetical protein